jgi:hypothetical protein
MFELKYTYNQVRVIEPRTGNRFPDLVATFINKEIEVPQFLCTHTFRGNDGGWSGVDRECELRVVEVLWEKGK